MYIALSILMFGLLVAVHELGHFLAAKRLGVRVNEFSIGMGPAIVSRQKGETKYSLRALPIGGYCAMEGEDEETGDPAAFTAQPRWKRFVILFAGPFMNLVAGLLLLLLVYSQTTAFVMPVIDDLMPGFPLRGEEGLLPGDRIVKIDGERVYLYEDVSLLLSRTGEDGMDLTIVRDGRKIEYKKFPLRRQEYTVDGQSQLMYGLIFTRQEATPGLRIGQSFRSAADFVRLVRLSLGDLLRGRAGLKDLSGPIGIVHTIADVGEQSETVGLALRNIGYFAALIAVNLAVMNLLPLPALDGGRILFLAIDGVFHLCTGRHVDPKYEGYVHMAGLYCLLALMAVVALNDILRLVR